MPIVNYCHADNLHTSSAPKAIVPIILDYSTPGSVLDVGCGTGVWLEEFLNNGISDLCGIDGVPINNRAFSVPGSLFKHVDLNQEWTLERRFDLAICLEVAEHLLPESAHRLVRSLCLHSDYIVFSAACPNQGGQGHINCQWPIYWQEIFNANQYACSDPLRPKIWQEEFPEYWYKQNIFVAVRDAANAGREERLASLVHPQLLEGWVAKWEGQNGLIDGRNGLRSSTSHAIHMLTSAAAYSISRRFRIKD